MFCFFYLDENLIYSVKTKSVPSVGDRVMIENITYKVIRRVYRTKTLYGKNIINDVDIILSL